MAKRPWLFVAAPIVLVALHAQTVPAFSGVWTRKAQRGLIIVQVSPGWRGVVANLAAHPPTVSIAQTASSISLMSGHGQAAVAYPVDASKNVNLEDHGDWWVKSETSSNWDGSSLSITQRTTSGWRHDLLPEEARVDRASQDTMMETTRVLNLSPDRREMTIRTTVRDEKGAAEYVEAFVATSALERSRADP